MIKKIFLTFAMATAELYPANSKSCSLLYAYSESSSPLIFWASLWLKWNKMTWLCKNRNYSPNWPVGRIFTEKQFSKYNWQECSMHSPRSHCLFLTLHPEQLGPLIKEFCYFEKGPRCSGCHSLYSRNSSQKIT